MKKQRANGFLRILKIGTIETKNVPNAEIIVRYFLNVRARIWHDLGTVHVTTSFRTEFFGTMEVANELIPFV